MSNNLIIANFFEIYVQEKTEQQWAYQLEGMIGWTVYII